MNMWPEYMRIYLDQARISIIQGHVQEFEKEEQEKARGASTMEFFGNIRAERTEALSEQLKSRIVLLFDLVQEDCSWVAPYPSLKGRFFGGVMDRVESISDCPALHYAVLNRSSKSVDALIEYAQRIGKIAELLADEVEIRCFSADFTFNTTFNALQLFALNSLGVQPEVSQNESRGQFIPVLKARRDLDNISIMPLVIAGADWRVKVYNLSLLTWFTIHNDLGNVTNMLSLCSRVKPADLLREIPENVYHRVKDIFETIKGYYGYYCSEATEKIDHTESIGVLQITDERIQSGATNMSFAMQLLSASEKELAAYAKKVDAMNHNTSFVRKSSAAQDETMKRMSNWAEKRKKIVMLLQNASVT